MQLFLFFIIIISLLMYTWRVNLQKQITLYLTILRIMFSIVTFLNYNYFILKIINNSSYLYAAFHYAHFDRKCI